MARDIQTHESAIVAQLTHSLTAEKFTIRPVHNELALGLLTSLGLLYTRRI